MPIFEYRCSICEHDFEELIRRVGDEAEVQCPECGSHEVGKKMSVFGFSSGGNFVASAGGGCASCAGGHCATCSTPH